MLKKAFIISLLLPPLYTKTEDPRTIALCAIFAAVSYTGLKICTTPGKENEDKLGRDFGGLCLFGLGTLGVLSSKGMVTGWDKH